MLNVTGQWTDASRPPSYGLVNLNDESYAEAEAAVYDVSKNCLSILPVDPHDNNCLHRNHLLLLSSCRSFVKNASAVNYIGPESFNVIQ